MKLVGGGNSILICIISQSPKQHVQMVFIFNEPECFQFTKLKTEKGSKASRVEWKTMKSHSLGLLLLCPYVLGYQTYCLMYVAQQVFSALLVPIF